MLSPNCLFEVVSLTFYEEIRIFEEVPNGPDRDSCEFELLTLAEDELINWRHLMVLLSLPDGSVSLSDFKHLEEYHLPISRKGTQVYPESSLEGLISQSKANMPLCF